ncbi:MAG: Flp pilus assembly protein CpaB [Actinomycetia bacterium]|nr:Flp pilus assembly protein CpaB [Actinomycetota bacterium]MCG2788568.1 Flp pilus assembly protein CpaB [Actinomycetes bacterium]
MKVKILLLILAIIFGLAAVFGVMFYINNLRASIEKEGEKIDVLVATQDIIKDTSVEEIISKKLVEVKKIPRRYIVAAYMTSLDKYQDYFVSNQISKGEQITPVKFIKSSDITFSFEVPKGMVAISIPFNEVVGVSNLLTVGDRVNVIATFLVEQQQQVQQQDTSSQTADTSGTQSNAAGNGNGGAASGNDYSSGNPSAVVTDTTKTVLWNIEILYIGAKVIIDELSTTNKGLLSSSGSSKEPVEIKTVTLAVTPEQAEKLVFSEELGTVWLALLPVGGVEETDTPGRTLDNIFIK